MKKIVLAVAIAIPILTLPAQVGRSKDGRYEAANQLRRPTDYREWIWLTSGLGMAYGPAAQRAESPSPLFDNVFVTPDSYRSFLKTGKWPDKTMFALELRSSEQNASINSHGYSQGDKTVIEVHVKDEKRFPRKWAFYSFKSGTDSAEPIAETADCFTCHEKNGALDSTFAQFYPTIREVAKQKGTLQSER